MNIFFCSGNKKRFNKTENSFFKCFLIFFLILTNSTLLHAEENDSIILSKNQSEFIYFGSDITIQGTAYIYTGEITEGEKKSIPGNKVKSQEQVTSPSNKIAFSKKNILKNTIQEEKLRKLQKEISRKVENCNYSNSQDISLNQLAKKIMGTSAVSTTSMTYGSGKAILHEDCILNSFGLQLAKQKFYTSISHLQFSKLTDSLLRGPPYFS